MSNVKTAPKVMFYVQHLLGIGHLARASRIADAMADDGFDVTVVTGGNPVAGFPGDKINHIALPPIVSGDAGFSGLCDSDGNPIDDAFKAMRRDLLIETYREILPDIVMIEAFPFGRRQVRFELLPLLDAIHADENRPQVVCSVRDILQERPKPGRDAESVSYVQKYFDLVVVHGDPAFIRLEETFPLAAEIQDQIAYSGIVAAPASDKSTDAFDVVVSAGGGAVGIDLVRASLEAAQKLPELGTWCVIAGPNMPVAEFEEVSENAPENVSLVRFRKDFPSLLAAARLSISQAGYNTVCDILNARCRSVLVPFAAGGETEQGVRAERLEKLGLAHVIAEDGLTGDAMTQCIQTAMNAPAPPAFALGLDGAHQTACVLRRHLGRA